MINEFLRKSTLALIALGLFFGSFGPAFAETTGSTGTGGDAQASAYASGNSTSGGGTQGAVKNVGVNLLGCSAGQLLAQMIMSGFNTLFNSVIDGAIGLEFQYVPIVIKGQQANNIQAQTQAHTVQQHFGVPFGSSFDAMGWCIVNSIISYVADATIAWANSGFNGQPAFLQNPDRFFESLADQQAATFIHDLAYNATGINLCQPFRVEISVGLSNAYGGGYQQRAACSMDQMYANLKNFSSKNISITSGTNNSQYYARNNQAMQNYWSNFSGVSHDQNNKYGSYLMANDELSARISKQQNTAKFELGLNKGWLNFKKCENNNDPKSCNTYTPGTLIESSLEKTLGLPKDRLVAVQKFDQVITAVVNALIKVALEKVLDGKNSNGTQNH